MHLLFFLAFVLEQKIKHEYEVPDEKAGFCPIPTKRGIFSLLNCVFVAVYVLDTLLLCRANRP